MAAVEIIHTGKRQTVVEGIAQGLIRYIAEKGLTAGDRLPAERVGRSAGRVAADQRTGRVRDGLGRCVQHPALSRPIHRCP